MFDILIRELGARFGTGEQSKTLLRIVLAYMTNKEAGGIVAFLDQFKKAGMGPVIQSWLGNTVSPKPLSNTQVENVLGGSGGLLDVLSRQVNAPRDNLAGAVAYLLPALVAKLTPGGSIPNHLPAEVSELIGDAKSLLAMPVEAVSGGTGGFGKWLPVLIGGVVVAAGLTYCANHPSSPEVSTPPAEVASQTTPAAPVASDSASVAPSVQAGSSSAVDAASQAASSESAVPAASEASGASAPAAEASAVQVELKAAPDSASVMAGEAHGIPLLQVFFDSSSSAVPSEFADKSAALLAYLKANPGVTAAVSGFNDATGDPALNAKLSKERAEAVRSALLAQGLDEARVVLEKPSDPTEGHAAAARRVNVVIRH